MNALYLGNAVCFLASVLMTLIGFIKVKKRFLLAQSGMNALFIAGNLLLGGIAGALTNAMTMLRNFYLLRRGMGRGAKLFFIALHLLLGAVFRVEGLIAWFPILGACLLTWCMDSEDMVLFKGIFVLFQLLCAVYDASIRNYATVPFDLAAAVTNGVALVSILRERKRAAAEEKPV